MNEDMEKLAIGFITCGESTAKYLPYFLESLRAQTFQDFTILVQDNSEKKDNFNKFTFVQAYPEVDYEWSGGNLGFAKAHNLLIKRARKMEASFYLAINPDMILEPDAVEKLIVAVKNNEEIASVSPKILQWNFLEKKKTQLIDTCGIIETSALRFSDLGQGEPDRGQYENKEILGPSGAAALFRMSALEKVKEGETYFDENMFMYYEDCDLVYRLQRAGYKSKIVSDAKIYHDRTAKAEGESDLRVALNRKNKSKKVKRWSFLNKHIIFIKYWKTLSLEEKFEVLCYAFKMFIFVFLFEQYLLKQYSKLLKLVKEEKITIYKK